ncbi:hypothetical protein ElP_53640 [Tautonia plasticadhaerens]|uniref:Uncharacterized protein n=2 Tax=Tautonia plasticadhaerens TaxID=2527974 RepID=A0A518H993_9BACT|nr:hypothetical protein ElP_53640 [Tautonia plasticadhaerens]
MLDGFRRFVLAGSTSFAAPYPEEEPGLGGSVLIDLEDGCFQECSGTLEVTDVDGLTMSVACENGHSFEMEHDAFDAGFEYVLEFLSRRDSG